MMLFNIARWMNNIMPYFIYLKNKWKEKVIIMALLKTSNRKDKYHDLAAREDVARYIFNPYKMYNGYCGGVGVTEDVVGSMNSVAVKFGKVNGLQLRHFVLSFPPNEIDDPEIANDIARQVARFIGKDFQIVFAVHENTENLHIHFMQNQVSYKDGHRYKGNKKEYYQLVNFITDHLRTFYRIPLVTVSSLSNQDIH